MNGLRRWMAVISKPSPRTEGRGTGTQLGRGTAAAFQDSWCDDCGLYCGTPRARRNRRTRGALKSCLAGSWTPALSQNSTTPSREPNGCDPSRRIPVTACRYQVWPSWSFHRYLQRKYALVFCTARTPPFYFVDLARSSFLGGLVSTPSVRRSSLSRDD